MSGGRNLSFTRDQIIHLLEELGQDLESRDVKAQLFIVGGAAMALAFNTRRTTADIDGVFEPMSLVNEAARRIAERHEQIPADWLNDAVKVRAARTDRDPDDIRFLADACGAKSADEVLNIAEAVIGKNRLAPKAQFLVQEMFPPAKPPLWERVAKWRQRYVR